MNNILVKSGTNLCFWNVDDICTNYDVTRNDKIDGYNRDWDSRQNCTVTIYGTKNCQGYLEETK